MPAKIITSKITTFKVGQKYLHEFFKRKRTIDIYCFKKVSTHVKQQIDKILWFTAIISEFINCYMICIVVTFMKFLLS